MTTPIQTEQPGREPCPCGCGEYPKLPKSRYVPGHDQRVNMRKMRELGLVG